MRFFAFDIRNAYVSPRTRNLAEKRDGVFVISLLFLYTTRCISCVRRNNRTPAVYVRLSSSLMFDNCFFVFFFFSVLFTGRHKDCFHPPPVAGGRASAGPHRERITRPTDRSARRKTPSAVPGRFLPVIVENAY